MPRRPPGPCAAIRSGRRATRTCSLPVLRALRRGRETPVKRPKLDVPRLQGAALFRALGRLRVGDTATGLEILRRVAASRDIDASVRKRLTSLWRQLRKCYAAARETRERALRGRLRDADASLRTAESVLERIRASPPFHLGSPGSGYRNITKDISSASREIVRNARRAIRAQE